MSDETAIQLLRRCRTVLRNMALEHEGSIFWRWPINHEPLRADAKNLVPLIDDFMAANQSRALEGANDGVASRSAITPALDAAIQDEIEHGPKDIMK